MSRLFFVLGSHPALSTAEIAAVVGPELFQVAAASPQILVLEDDGGRLDASELMSRLGGTIKIGWLTGEEIIPETEALAELMYAHLTRHAQTGRRVAFGYSAYNLGGSARAAANKLKNAGMEAKTRLKEAGFGARWVKSQEGPALSSVAVAKNKLIEEGAEFILLAGADNILVGVTETVQPFAEFSANDYGRPARDTIQGMLPPKLARLMINLAGAPRSGAILDPFCGSGTVLTEALRLGYASVVGGDKNPEAVQSSMANLDWLRQREPALAGRSEVICSDARNLIGKIGAGEIAAVVSEPFLGPPRNGRETRGELQKTLSELTKLYFEALCSWKRLLQPNAAVVMVLPIFVLGREKHGLSGSELAKAGYVLEPLLPPALLAKLDTPETKNKGLTYNRPDQLVWREIVRLRLK